jgi:hypothetical protein
VKSRTLSRYGSQSLRVCLTNNKTLHGGGEYYSHYFFYFFTFSNNNSHQNILTLFTFYITSIFFYYLNKNIHYNTNFFTFLYKFFLLYITSSLLLISKLTTHYSSFFYSLPNKPASLCYFYYVVARIRPGMMRLLSLLPIFLPLHNPPLEPQLHPYRQLYNLLPGLAWQLQAPPPRLRSRPFNASSAEALSLHLHSFPSHQDQSKPISPKCHKSSQIHFVAYKSLASCSDYLII